MGWKKKVITLISVVLTTGIVLDIGKSFIMYSFDFDEKVEKYDQHIVLYVDNIFVFQPLPYVKTMYYLDVNFYRYFIGRSDQSVNEQVMIGRIDQQIRVTKLMMGYYDVTKLQNKKLRRYMTRYLEIMMVVSSILAIRSGTDENMAKKKELWEYVKKTNPRLYIRLRFGFLGQGMNLPGKGGRQISIAGYKIAQKFFGFN